MGWGGGQRGRTGSPGGGGSGKAEVREGERGKVREG